MSTSSHLFDLIKSLSKNEKRYFKLFCTLQQGEKNYLKLFDFMDSLKRYDEQVILDHFMKADFVKNIHVTKNYLYNLILKSLRIYGAEKNVKIQLANLWIEIDILERRGLNQQLWERLQKTKKIAIKYHDHLSVVRACRKELSFVAEWETKKTKGRLEEITEEIARHFRLLEEEYEALDNYYFMTFNYRKFHNNLNLLKEKTSQVRLLESVDRYKNSFTTCYIHYYLKALEYRIDGNQLLYNEYLKKAISVWNEYRYMIRERPRVYKIYLANYLSSCHILGKYDEFPIYLEELKSIPSTGFKEEVETFQNAVFYELLYRLNTENYKNIDETIQSIEKGLEKYEYKINQARITAFNYNISLLFFFNRDFEKALTWLNKILNDTKNEHRKDIQRFANILQLVYHLELGNTDLVYNLQSSVRRKLKRWGDISRFEGLIFDYLKAFLDCTSLKESNQLNADFYITLLTFKQENNTQQPAGLGELIQWISNKNNK